MCLFDDKYKKEVERLNTVLDFLESKCASIIKINKIMMKNPKFSENNDVYFLGRGSSTVAKGLLSAIKYDRIYFNE